MQPQETTQPFEITVRQLIGVYSRAWTKKDPTLLASIFTSDALYTEGPFSESMVGLVEIESYWNRRVVLGQRSIKFELKSLILCDPLAIAEWEASFVDLADGDVRKTIREIAILRISQGRISSLREYWHTQSLPPRATGPKVGRRPRKLPRQSPPS
jgi:hypothetical protein